MKLSSALAAITAAVGGVVLNLAVWFAMNLLLPHDAPFNLFAALLGLISFVAIQWGGLRIVLVVLASGAVGLIRFLL